MTTDLIVTLIAGLLMLVGCVGIVVPVLPGSILIGVCALVWALVLGGGPVWTAFAVIAVLVGIGISASWVLTGRKLKERGIPNSSLLLGGVLAVVGFFVVPVVGLLLGFVAGLWLAERRRLGDAREAWDTSWSALKVAGVGILIEFGCAAVALAVFAGTAIHHFLTLAPA
ncbi:DUF456 domain-containing protein [Brevibacterium album]|uniref:DUF456 domain-containing protein n=1 Tax=Brevibacterium album TaxID=417948 RepID=UPI0003F9CD99|nr:DUF456 domain-containing protein [Brevibacterium album]